MLTPAADRGTMRPGRRGGAGVRPRTSTLP